MSRGMGMGRGRVGRTGALGARPVDAGGHPSRASGPALPPGVAVSEAARIAARNLVHRRLSNALLVLLIGFSVLSYLATSLFAADTRGGMVTSLDLGLDRALLVRLQGWSFLETRYLDHPLASERPRTETDYLCLLTEEQGGPLDTIRRHASVDQVWIARLVTLQLPWGTGDLLSVEEKAPPLADVKFVSGRPPGTLREIAVPEDIAVLAGLKPGSQVSYLATDTEKESAAFSEGTLVVSGVFRSGSLFFRGAVGWLPSSYPSSYVTDLWAHYPRVLENFEPNCYLVTLQERADVRMFAEWLVETWYQDHRGHWHIQPRYPVLSLWSNDVANEFLGQGLSLGTTALSGIIGLSLVFVGIGTLTILLLAFMERRREVAILKAVGLSGGDIALIFALEVSYVAILGMAIGLGLAALVLKAWLGTPIDWRLAVRSAAVTALVLYLSSMLPVAMARSATVAELLSGQRVIAIFRSRVGAIGAPAAGRFRARRPGA